MKYINRELQFYNFLWNLKCERSSLSAVRNHARFWSEMFSSFVCPERTFFEKLMKYFPERNYCRSIWFLFSLLACRFKSLIYNWFPIFVDFTHIAIRSECSR